LQKPGARISN
jgi:hypothetical protein